MTARTTQAIPPRVEGQTREVIQHRLADPATPRAAALMVAANRMEAFTRTNIGVSMYVIIALLGCVAAVLGIYGDLFASVVKRQCGIKDYGTIFPGHGGILDRFDSVMLIAPFVTMVITAVFYY